MHRCSTMMARPFLGSMLAVVLVTTACVGSDEPAAAPSGSPPSQPAESEADIVGNPAGPVFKTACGLPSDFLQRLRRGYFADRSQDIVLVPREPNYFGSFTTTTHSGPWDYLQDVPLVFYGPGFVAPVGETRLNREVTVADIAPTIAQLVDAPWPDDRAGKPLTEILLPEEQRPDPPAVVVTVVWDGGGWNVLERWADSWPNLESLMAQGASVVDATVGSSPSVTPAIHATIGTGTFPKQHGIVDIIQRSGDQVVGSWDAQNPTYLETQTLADLFDQATGNQALIGMVAEKGWHLGMIGHGAELEGADKDIAAMGDVPGKLYTNGELYGLPSYLQDVPGLDEDVRAVDIADGRLDFKWLGHEMLEQADSLRLTPVWILYQLRLLKRLVAREDVGSDDVPDLLFTNFKQIDLMGHAWNMLEPEVRDGVQYSDQVLGELVAFLNSEVGENRWVLVMTADHGQAPDAAAVGAWPINIDEMSADIAGEFGLQRGDLILEDRPGALWINRRAASEASITLDEISEFLIRYRIKDNAASPQEVPEGYRERLRERLFSTAFPYTWMPQVWDCSKKRSRGDNG